MSSIGVKVKIINAEIPARDGPTELIVNTIFLQKLTYLSTFLLTNPG